MNWLRKAINDNSTGLPSTKRIGLLCATFALSVAVLILSAAFFYGHDTSVALGAVAVPLAGLNGYSYVGGLKQEKAP